jgi:hypothetical protein
MITIHGASGTTRPMAQAQLMREFATFTGRLVELRDCEPPRELRRLLTLGGWSHEQATAAGDVPG